MILVGFVLKIINKHIKEWSNIRIQNNEKIVNSNLNLVSGIKEILIFGKVSNILNQFSNSLKSLEYVDRKNNLVTTYPKILLEQSVILIFILIIFFLSFYNVATDEIIVILSFYLTAAYRLVPSINKIFVSIQQLKFGKPSILKIMDFYSLEKKNKFLEHDKFNETLNFNKEILLKSFKFGYSASNQIFNNLNLKIKKNEIIGISGQSGSGKSTIINLLTTLIKPDSGKLLIDQNIIETSEDYRKYQNLFSISSQDTYLLDASIKENIIFDFNTKINEDRLHKAINFANLGKMISDLPKGLDTQVGSTLKQLSSGQKQRIAIARLIYSNREILVFDEATNALDEKNEKEIFKKLNKLRKDKTIIIISHNQENLKICDRVYKIENKEIFEVKL
jgi:ABC-type multidrug transport system fused ATPase/permease subunit